MHDGAPFAGLILPAEENISGTFGFANADDLPLDPFGCAFIAAAAWPAGFPPFCGLPVVPGSAYCRRHAGRCRGFLPEQRR